MSIQHIPYSTPTELKQKLANEGPSLKQSIKKIKAKKPKQLDNMVHDLHDEAFEQFDCLDCANCCKTISPIVTLKDIDRLAKPLKMKPGEVIEQYLEIDSDNDYVFREHPCPFLMPDNYCMVYEYRPKACREYPHTDRKRFHQLLNLSMKNAEVCPVVFEIVKVLKDEKF